MSGAGGCTRSLAVGGGRGLRAAPSARRRLWPPVAASLLFAAPLAAQDAAAVLRRAERAHGDGSSLTAEFTQTIMNPMLGAPETTHGKLFLLPPGRFAMRFTDPEGERIVADGTWLWLYAPSSVPNQVIRQPVPQTGAQTPNLIAQFVDRPLERYEATLVGVDTVRGHVVDVVRLIPRETGLGFRNAEIGVDRDDGLLRRIALVEPSGQRRRIVLHDIRTGVRVPAREVTFEVPKGTRVVTP